VPPLRRSTCGGRRETRVPKTAGRLIREVVYGIQSRGSVRLSEIARSLEEGTSLKKIIDRLSRQLSRAGLRERVRENLLRLAAGRIGEETLLVIDPTDIGKRYARSMEYLARVRDGSEGVIRDGYGCWQVVAARRGSAEVPPLYQELYSQDAHDFDSENDEILKAVEKRRSIIWISAAAWCGFPARTGNCRWWSSTASARNRCCC
jgi:hypothetical protein